MDTLVVEGLDLLATFDAEDTILQNASIHIDGSTIRSITSHTETVHNGSKVIDGRGKLALPGFINVHHHFFQQLTRAERSVHTAPLLDWLRRLYPTWYRLDARMVYAASRLAVAQLLLTGCTSTTDMTYLYPRSQVEIFDATVEAAADLGIRFHPCRAALLELEADLSSRLQIEGLEIQELSESADRFMAECERVVKRYHDPNPHSMCQVNLGLTEKTYHDPELMRQLAIFAQDNHLLLHTHLHPRADEIELCRSLYGQTPLEFLEEVGWMGTHVWLAHGTALDNEAILHLSRTGTGVSHSPSSNMRLGLPVMPLPQLLQEGVRVGVGVDGGASNDSGDFIGELRLALFVHRISELHSTSWDGPSATDPYGILRLGTRGGAAILGRSDIGSLEPGKCADIVLYRLDHFNFAGARTDPLAALLLCGESHIVDTTIVQGEVVVENGQLTRVDEEEIAFAANRASRQIHFPDSPE